MPVNDKVVDVPVGGKIGSVDDPIGVVKGEVTEKGLIYPENDFTYEEAETGFAVEVHAPDGALPMGTEMRVARLNDLANVQAAVDAAENLNGDVQLAADISFWFNGEEIEPAEGSKLLVRMSAPEIEGIAAPVVIHIPDGENAVPEIIEQMRSADEVVALTNTVEFEASDFSVYALLDDSAYSPITLTVEFYDGPNNPNNKINTQVVRQDQITRLAAPIYDPGVPDITNTQSFEGWTTDENYGDTTVGQSVEELNVYIKDHYAAMEESETLTLYAMTFDVRYIVYHDQAGAVLKTQSFHVPSNGNKVSVKISLPYVGFMDGQNFAGWVLQGENGITNLGDYPTYGSTLEPLYENDKTYQLNVTQQIYPYLNSGNWLVFDNYIDQDDDTTTASYTSPVFVNEGENTVAPATPTRTGYEFKGWYKEKSFTNRFIFGSTINEDTTVYAKWEAKETTYRVTFWQQMNTDPVDADDADKTYSHYTPTAVTVIRTAHTGDQVSITEADTRLGNRNDSTTDYGEMGFYFVYNANKSDTAPVTVKGDGSTVLNVYYDRKTITISFYTDSSKNTLAALAKYEEAENGGYYYYPYATGYYLIGTGPNADAQYSYGTTVYYHDSYSSSNLPSYDNVTKYYSSSGMSNHSLNSSNTYQSWIANEKTLIYQYTYYGTTYYRPLYYYFSSQGVGYYPVGEGPDPTAAGTHNRISISNPLVGLYDAPLPNWPDEPEGQEWDYDDAEDGKHYGITVRDTFNIPDDKYTTEWDIYGETPNWTAYKTIHWMIQDLNGNYTEKSTSKLGEGVTQYYDDGKFMGFDAKGHNLTANDTTTGFVAYNGTETGIGYSDAGNDAYIFFDRRSNELEFVSMNQSVRTEQVPYEKPLSEYSDTIPENGEAGYYFDGWYADPGFDTLFDFTQEMPNHAVVVYAKWTMMRFRVVLDPTGGDPNVTAAAPGEPSMNSNEVNFPGNQATTFRVDYGELVQGSSINNAQRKGYTLLGWYLDKAYTIPYNFANPLTTATPNVDMTYADASDAERSGVDPWNQNSPNWTDVGRDNVRGKLTIYAKWRQDPNGIIGINVRYLADDKDGNTGTFSDDSNTWDDPDIYADRAQAYAQPASTPDNDDDLQFLYWDILTHDEGSTVLKSSGRKAYPGQTWEVLLSDALQENVSAPSAGTESFITYGTENAKVTRPGEIARPMAESADLDAALNVSGGTLHFTTSDNYSWTVPSGESYAQSGNYNIASTNSYLYLNGLQMEAGETLSFKYYCNSESDTWDYLRFYFNNSYDTTFGNKGGPSTSWGTYTWTAPADGTYSFYWQYHKDGSVNGGTDCARIDDVEYTPNTVYYNVTFIDGFTNEPIGEVQKVEEGAAAVAPVAPDHTAQGMIFDGWDDDYSYITKDTVITARYVDQSNQFYTVTFRYMQSDGTWTTISRQVQHGHAAEAPNIPTPPEGYTFNSWDKVFNNITSNLTVNAVYKQVATTKYVVTLQAVYGRKTTEAKTHIYWYANNDETGTTAGPRQADNDLSLNTGTAIPTPETWTSGTRDSAAGLSYPGHVFLGWARIENTSASGENAPAMPDLVEDDLYLRWVEATDTVAAHYEAKNNSGTWVTVTEVAGDEEQPYHDMYAVWAKVFYVYHSSNNQVEKFVIDNMGSVDLAHYTAYGMLYGGYYKDYSGKSTNFAAESLPDSAWTKADETSLGISTAEGEKVYQIRSSYTYKDEGAQSYDGTKTLWNSSAACEVNGLRVLPEAGETYYIKEVPEKYLKSMVRYTYYNNTEKSIGSIFIMAPVDTDYKGFGIMVHGQNEDPVMIKGGQIADSVTLKPKKGDVVKTYNAGSLIEPKNPSSWATYSNNKVGYIMVMNIDLARAKDQRSSQPFFQLIAEHDVANVYWITPDNVRVTGVWSRTYSNLEAGTLVCTGETAPSEIVYVGEQP
jgi:uncharacterized repeat protein (TIGR02543 family)